MLKYVELKTGYADNGPAWIAQVTLSKSGRTVYFNGKALQRLGGRGIAGNHRDSQTGEEYWVSGVKRRGGDRHPAGSGVIMIEASAVAEYLMVTGQAALDAARFKVVSDLEVTDRAAFHARENEGLET